MGATRTSKQPPSPRKVVAAFALALALFGCKQQPTASEEVGEVQQAACNVVCTPGACETATCSGNTCTKTKKAAGTVCRASAGTCDVQEVCDGVSANCPANTVLAAGTVCRAAAGGGLCDIPETCNGTS